MPTRIDIELTSAGTDGAWTWRAAGAREPKGVLDGSILPEGSSVGDRLKAETERDLDGVRVLSIVTSTAKGQGAKAGLLELLPVGEFEPVTQQRAQRDRGDRGGDRGDRRGRPRRDRDDRGPRGDRDDRGPRGGRDGGGRDGGGRDGGGRDGGGRDGADRRGDRRGGERAEGGDRDRRHRPHFTPPPELPQRPKPKRLRPGKLRRGEVLASIPEEQRPVAELALQGVAAVRQRVRDDNAKLAAEGKPTMPEATILKMAEELLPRLRVADWLDRAEAAKRQLEHLDLRDLRSVVAASDDPVVARDETTRALAIELKEALVVKQAEELDAWLSDVEANVDIGRVVRALKLSAMPPKAGVPFPAALGAKLGEATTAALGPNDPPERWVTVLEAAAFSPVRSSISVAAAPTQGSDELTATVTRLAPLLPQVASVFSIEVDPKAAVPKPLRTPPRKRDAPAGRKPDSPDGARPAKPVPRAKPESSASSDDDQPATEPNAAPVEAAAEAPVTEPPVTEPPVTEASVIEAPVTEAPVAEAPVEPSTDGADEAPTADVPADVADAEVVAETPAAEAPDA